MKRRSYCGGCFRLERMYISLESFLREEEIVFFNGGDIFLFFGLYYYFVE